MGRGIPAEPVTERNEETLHLQEGVLTRQEAASAGGFLAREDPGPGSIRRSCWSTTDAAWSDGHLWIVLDALYLSGAIPAPDECAVTVHSNVDRGPYRCPVAPKCREQNGALPGKRCE